MKFFIPVRSDRGTGDMRGERATTDTCSLHEKQLLRASWDNLHWTKYFSDRSDDWNICQTIYTWCQWEHCCKRITFGILEIVSLPFHKQFFQCWLTGVLFSLRRPGLDTASHQQYISVVIQQNVPLLCPKSSNFVLFPLAKWSGNFLGIILLIHLLVLKSNLCEAPC